MLKPISLWIRIALLLMLAAVAVMRFAWMPTAVDYASDFLGGASRPVLYALGGYPGPSMRTASSMPALRDF